MAKRKSSRVRRSWWLGLLRLLFLSRLRYFLLLVAIVVLLYWQWPSISSWINEVTTGIWRLFGWGLLLILVALLTLVIVVWRRTYSSLIHHGNRWLASIIFLLVVWGILAFFNQGGDFGLGIIAKRNLVGVLRLAGLLIIGIVLIAPRPSGRLVIKAFAWLGKRIKGWLSHLLLRRRQQPTLLSVEVSSKNPEPAEPEVEKKLAPPVRSPIAAVQGLKQVAQEVWKKYGESPSTVIVDGWRLPPIDILDKSPEIQFSQADNVQRARLIEDALGSYGVEVKVVQINTGPTVTQFGVEPGWDRKLKEVKERDRDGNVKVKQEEVSRTRVKVERITSLANDMALALAAPSIRIEAPVPGKSIVGIEVPNTTSSMVSLRGVIETSVFQKVQSKAKLGLALGKGAGGEAVAADLARMPHLLIAGATGSGKTVCLNTIVCGLLLYNTPYDVQFVMIDPKRVELTMFNSIPHLTTPVIVDTDRAIDALRWLNQEMDRRYQKLATVSARNIEAYNKNRQGSEKMPYVVLIIDELADLMMAVGDEVERILCRLAQLARAIGIHLVVATQRPSVDVVTGLIKANFPTRISFAVTSQVDSRTILDMVGAEKLLGSGDMLYMPTEAGKPKRLQGCYVSDAEAERLVYFWGSQRKQETPPLKIEKVILSHSGGRKGSAPEDPILEAARQLAKEHPQISASFLQRKLNIGYPRAARLMDQLEEEKGKPEEQAS